MVPFFGSACFYVSRVCAIHRKFGTKARII
jgi:hypothetical protein